MPESVKKLLADLIEMYGIYGELLCLFSQKEVHPIYILHFDSLFENRIQEPLEEAEALRTKLAAHFEQIKYEHQDFTIKFQTDINNLTSDVSQVFGTIFKTRKAIEIIQTFNASLKDVRSTMDKFHMSLLEYAGFYNESIKNSYDNRLKLLVNQLKNPTKKELPVVAKAILAKLLPEIRDVDPNTLIQYINNRAVVAIMMRLVQYEPWNTLTNPEAIEKVFGNMTGTNDERFKKIFTSPAGIRSFNALLFTPEQENQLFRGNEEFVKCIYWIASKTLIAKKFSTGRILVKIKNNDTPIATLFKTNAYRNP